MNNMKTLTALTLLGGTLTLTPPAEAWIVVRRPYYVAPYVAPYYSYPVAPTYYVPTSPVEPSGGVVVAGGPGTVAPPVPYGSLVYALPVGTQSATINGAQYYVYGATYYRPCFGPNGVYYQVVPNPV
jgi:hypothetical protein